MPVSDTHPEYRDNEKSWGLVRDCVAGSRKVKESGTKYLPKPNPDDLSEENKSRYSAYKERANYVNFTGFTKDGMLGMVFRRDIQADFPQSIEYLIEDATGGGITFDQMSRSITGNVLEAGRQGILVDYPQAGEGLTQAQVAAQNLRANLIPYRAENILNWQTEMVGGIKMLTMLVLYEPKLEPSIDGFSYQEKKYYRVLKLEEGVYIQRLINEEGFQVGDDIIPKNGQGASWKEIPFVFIGSQNNDEIVDKAPLYDIAEINIGHYRNSADYEESCFMVGQPTPYAAGLSQGWVDEVMKGGVHIGSRAFLLLPVGGSAGLLQAAPNQMPLEAMKGKEMQMVMIGARIIQDSNTNETREGAKIRFGGQTSKLATIVGNVEAGLSKAIEYAMMFMGEGEYELKMNKEFYDASLDPQMVIAQIQLLDRGVISKSILRQDLRDGGMIEEEVTDDAIDTENEADNPLGGIGADDMGV